VIEKQAEQQLAADKCGITRREIVSVASRLDGWWFMLDQ